MQSQNHDRNAELQERLQRAWRSTGDQLHVLALSEILVQESIIEEQVKEIQRLDAALKSAREEQLRLAFRNANLAGELEGNLE